MRETPERALRRATMLAAATIAAVVLGSLGAARLTNPDTVASSVVMPPAGPAHAVAAPPQSLAATAELFASLGLGERDEPAPADDRAEPAAAPAPKPCVQSTDRRELAEKAPPAKPRVPVPGRMASEAVPDSATLKTAGAPRPAGSAGSARPSRGVTA